MIFTPPHKYTLELYWINENKTYTPLESNIRFYYFLAPNNNADPVIPFPDGLRILSGDAYRKVPDANNYIYICQTDPKRKYEKTALDFNFDQNCPMGLKTNLYMPNCWNGKDLWLPGGVHMSFNAGGGSRGGPCPWSHPFKIPSVMLEFTWMTNQYKPGEKLKGNLVWANGDMTGYGIHGDFINGWDRATLQKAMSTKGCIDTGAANAADTCSVFKESYDIPKAKNCTPDVGVVKEPEGNKDLLTLDSLPGCNLMWGKDPEKPTCANGFLQHDITPFQDIDGSHKPLSNQGIKRPIPTKAGWVHLGCIKHDTSFVQPTAYLWAANLTQEGCMKQCIKTGHMYAAVGGHADNCICSDGIWRDAPVMTGLCNAPCPGNKKQSCGTEYAFDVFGAGEGTTEDTVISESDWSKPDPSKAGIKDDVRSMSPLAIYMADRDRSLQQPGLALSPGGPLDTPLDRPVRRRKQEPRDMMGNEQQGD